MEYPSSARRVRFVLTPAPGRWRREVVELGWFDRVSGARDRPRHVVNVLRVVNLAEERVELFIKTLLGDE